MIHVVALSEIDQIVSDKDLDPEFQQMLTVNGHFLTFIATGSRTAL